MTGAIFQLPFDAGLMLRDFKGLQGMRAGSPQDDPKRLKKACQEFESLFIYYLLKTMREGITESSLFGVRREEKFYQSLVDQQLARQIASSEGIGVAEMLFDKLSA